MLAPAAPASLKTYLSDFTLVTERAQQWASSLEENLLKSVCTEPEQPPDDPPQQPLPLQAVPPSPRPVETPPEKEVKGSIDELQQRAEQLAVEILSMAYTTAQPDFGPLLAEKKSIVSTLLKRRERHLRDGETLHAERCASIAQFLVRRSSSS